MVVGRPRLPQREPHRLAQHRRALRAGLRRASRGREPLLRERDARHDPDVDGARRRSRAVGDAAPRRLHGRAPGVGPAPGRSAANRTDGHLRFTLAWE